MLESLLVNVAFRTIHLHLEGTAKNLIEVTESNLVP
jgi:hypothetical protein